MDLRFALSLNDGFSGAGFIVSGFEHSTPKIIIKHNINIDNKLRKKLLFINKLLSKTLATFIPKL